jgi:hypothetical protein
MPVPGSCGSCEAAREVFGESSRARSLSSSISISIADLAQLLHNCAVFLVQCDLFEDTRDVIAEAVNLTQELCHLRLDWYCAGLAQRLYLS